MNLAHELMHWLLPLFEVLVFLLNVLSILILAWGVLISSGSFIRSESRRPNLLRATRNTNFIRTFLGSYILLSLEVLIAADIIESIINPTFQDIVKLAALVVIRTLISHFLHQEMQDALDERENKRKH